MSNTLNLGTDGNWARKKGSLLAYNSENNNYKPLPFTFDRDSVATRVNKQGLIETVGADQPRVDYLNNTKGALKLEPSRTNLNTFSDPTDAQKGSTSYASVTFQDNFNWGLGSVLKNAIVFVDNSTTRYAYYNSTVSSGTEYTLSAFIKMDDDSVPIPATDFLMVLAGTSFASGYNVESYGNNIYRVSVSGTASASNTANGILKVASHSAKTFNVTGFQLEVGSYATSYIPTQGSAVTRLADSCNNGGNDQVINSTEGVLYAEIAALADDSTDRRISISDGTTNNRMCIGFDNASNKIKYFLISSNTIQTSEDVSVSNITQFNKIAFKFKANDFKLYINGSVIASDTSGSTFSANTLNVVKFAGFSGTSQNFYGNVKDLRVYNTALTDQELAALTQV